MTHTWNLNHRVAVVTGATSGIGAATAKRLAAGGASVALLGRREDRLKALADELRATATGSVLPVAVDLTDAEAVTAAAGAVTGALGAVDLVVANAGVMLGAPFERAETDEWDRMIDVNLRGLLHTSRAFTDDLLAAASRGARRTSSTSAPWAGISSSPTGPSTAPPRPPSPTSRAICAPNSGRAASA